MPELGPSQSDAAQGGHAAACRRRRLLPELHAVQQPACCSTRAAVSLHHGTSAGCRAACTSPRRGPGSSKPHRSRPLWPLSCRPNEGSVRFNVEFSPMASPNFDAGRPGEAAIELARLVERSLRETRAIDQEALCVLAGRKVRVRE